MNMPTNIRAKKAESLQINSVGQRPMTNRTICKTTSPARA